MKYILKWAVILLVIFVFVNWHSEAIERFINRLKHVQISDIKADPGKYDGAVITLRGQVRESYDVPSITRDLYRFKDESGEIWVLAHVEAPRMGTEMDLKGMISAGEEYFGSVRINRAVMIEIKKYIQP